MQPKLKLGVYVAQAVGKARSDSPNNGVTLDMTNVLMPALGALIAKLEPPPAVPSNANVNKQHAFSCVVRHLAHSVRLSRLVPLQQDYVGTFVSSAAGASLTLSVDPTTGGVVGVANSQLEVATKAVPRAWDQPEGSVDTMAAALGLTNADSGTSFSLNWIGADSFQLVRSAARVRTGCAVVTHVPLQPQTSGETCGVYENGMTFNWVFQRYVQTHAVGCGCAAFLIQRLLVGGHHHTHTHTHLHSNGNNEVTAFTVQGNGVYPYIFNKQ